MIREFSAGGAVVRRFQGRPFMACVLVKRGTVRALPKGHIEDGESAAEAALREVWEETGLRAEIEEKLDDVRYWYVRGRGAPRVFKQVSFFLCRYRSGSLRDYDPKEVDGAEWIPLDEAPRLLAYPGERRIAEAAVARISDGR